MEILGRGLAGIVIADTPGTVRKFYTTKDKGHSEQANLTFLGDLQENGLNIGCVIPRLVEVIGDGKWEMEGNTYTYCNRMERLSGTSARRVFTDFTEQAIKHLGEALGSTAFAIHNSLKPYVEQWCRAAGKQDTLLAHVLEDKAKTVQSEESDKNIVDRTSEAAQYLETQCQALEPENTLSHLDFSLANAQVDNSGRLIGVVDWVSFGLSNPSLSLYQLAYRELWPYVERQYE